jgi:hypothetical protein
MTMSSSSFTRGLGTDLTCCRKLDAVCSQNLFNSDQQPVPYFIVSSTIVGMIAICKCRQVKPCFGRVQPMVQNGIRRGLWHRFLDNNERNDNSQVYKRRNNRNRHLPESKRIGAPPACHVRHDSGVAAVASGVEAVPRELSICIKGKSIYHSRYRYFGIVSTTRLENSTSHTDV